MMARGKDKKYVYQTGPIDFFIGLPTIEQALLDAYTQTNDFADIPRFLMEAAHAVASASGSYWEGDISRMHFLAIPCPDENCTWPAFVWKQDNNGTTFIVSPVELPWLSNYELPCKG